MNASATLLRERARSMSRAPHSVTVRERQRSKSNTNGVRDGRRKRKKRLPPRCFWFYDVFRLVVTPSRKFTAYVEFLQPGAGCASTFFRRDRGYERRIIIRFLSLGRHCTTIFRYAAEYPNRRSHSSIRKAQLGAPPAHEVHE